MTYTVEVESDYTHIVILDPTGMDDDLTIDILEDGDVYLRQQCPASDQVDLILINYKMLVDLANSLNSTEGLHISG